MHLLTQWVVSRALLDPDSLLEFAEWLVLAAVILLMFLCPFQLKGYLRRAWWFVLQASSRRKKTVVLVAGLAPVVLRIAMLPALPIPVPFIADEFSHLLVADTIASGRTANPPHPMARHFETSYVLQHPAYASIYPPGHGFVMGIAESAGLHPWFGVVAETGLMAMAIAWMLQAWFPTRWVLLGSLLAILRLWLWSTSYWGGSLAAVGGALVIGSVKRILDGPRVRDSLMLGLGLTILANTRPFEGFLLGLAGATALALAIFRRWSPATWRTVVVPVACTLGAGGFLTGYYNWRVTQNPLVFPYVQAQRQYGVPQAMIFQPPVPPPASMPFKDIVDTYQWQRTVHDSSRGLRQWLGADWEKLTMFWHFYLHPLCLPPLLALPWAIRGRRMWFLLGAAVFVAIGMSLYPFYSAHYSAPLAGLVLILLIQGFRYLGALTRKARGGGLVAPIMTLGILGLGVFAMAGALAFPGGYRVHVPPRLAAGVMRQELEERLQASGQKHLVLVRYGPDHSFHWPVIYNRARIDESAVVWARDLGGAENEELLRYYPDRKVWLFEPDEKPPRFSPFHETRASFASTAGR
jgi:hypothetical protein